MNDIDWDGFLKRKGLTKSELAELIGAAAPMISGLVGGKNKPGHTYLTKLINVGMTSVEMFGKEAGLKLLENSSMDNNVSTSYDSPEFVKGVEKALEELRQKGVKV